MESYDHYIENMPETYIEKNVVASPRNALGLRPNALRTALTAFMFFSASPPGVSFCFFFAFPDIAPARSSPGRFVAAPQAAAAL